MSTFICFQKDHCIHSKLSSTFCGNRLLRDSKVYIYGAHNENDVVISNITLKKLAVKFNDASQAFLLFIIEYYHSFRDDESVFFIRDDDVISDEKSLRDKADLNVMKNIRNPYKKRHTSNICGSYDCDFAKWLSEFVDPTLQEYFAKADKKKKIKGTSPFVIFCGNFVANGHTIRRRSLDSYRRILDSCSHLEYVTYAWFYILNFHC